MGIDVCSSKKVPSHYSQIVVTTYSSFIAVILLTPFVIPRLKEMNLSIVVQPTISGGLLYLGIVSTAGGFLLWNKGLQLMNASSGGLFFFFQPVVGTFLGWLLLGRRLVFHFGWARFSFLAVYLWSFEKSKRMCVSILYRGALF